MTTHATAEAEMTSWTERTRDGRRHDEVTGPKQRAGAPASREGTFVLRHEGGFRDGVADATVTVVSAGGGPAGLTGSGRITRNGPGRLHLDHAL
ncbi:DUF3224 domain-containing protein [Saccharothrix xinjiangensis]|uniref:DUF3224 domain-containing protein n=1 Tax=Saccharothrix xinjiangensis TaxID=204798 RepID=A0ABV9Y816_9PSEU